MRGAVAAFFDVMIQIIQFIIQITVIELSIYFHCPLLNIIDQYKHHFTVLDQMHS